MARFICTTPLYVVSCYNIMYSMFTTVITNRMGPKAATL